MTPTLVIWLVIGALYAPFFWYMIRNYRRSSRKARIKRRMLVKEESGQLAWRTVRGRCLVGSSDSQQQVDWGRWAGDAEWAVIQAAHDKLVVYRFDKLSSRDDPRTGAIQVCDSWRELEAAVPADIFEEALLKAGVKKPDQYREIPLRL
jgi:hypothetical protein